VEKDLNGLVCRMKIIVKSIPEMWEKEKKGVKKATIRKLDGDDTIVFVNTETNETFEKRITDISIWKDWIIISFTDVIEDED